MYQQLGYGKTLLGPNEYMFYTLTLFGVDMATLEYYEVPHVKRVLKSYGLVVFLVLSIHCQAVELFPLIHGHFDMNTKGLVLVGNKVEVSV